MSLRPRVTADAVTELLREHFRLADWVATRADEPAAWLISRTRA
ncbi:hypothetical protein [Marinitenerispora sediminis]|nr:hypothetical protein [Marinitenerispora sediminis]